jgi:class 3 adenylate cyclase/pimeloyl-ACP methyl ester carboxylesterase
MEQQIGFCTTSDGVSIAYATVGSGPPLVYVCGWPAHLAMEWEQPFVREFLEAFGKSFTLVRYDMRGSGLSAGVDAEISLDTLSRDLEAVIDALGFERVALLSLGLLAGPVAVNYAVAHPERASRLVLLGPFLRGDQLANKEQQKAMIDYLSAFGQLVTPEYTDPRRQGLDPDQVSEAGAIHRASAPREVLGVLLREIFSVNMTDAVARLDLPVLVLHGSQDSRVPLALSRDLAARIKNVKFVPYTGSGSAPWADQEFILPEIFRFLGAEAATQGAGAGHVAVYTILFTDIEDSTALTQRLGDAKAQELVRAHNAIVREALRAHGGTEIKHTGDGIMASFHSASGALECAVAIQRAVEGHNAGVGAHGHAPLQVHIGLNAGEPVAEEQDLFGTAVQLARRICDASEGGEILASDVVRQLAAGKGFLFADRGETALRGFEDPVRLYEVRWRE